MDVDNRGGVNVTDLLALLAAWGSCLPPARPTSTVMAVVNVTDLPALPAAWRGERAHESSHLIQFVPDFVGLDESVLKYCRNDFQ